MLTTLPGAPTLAIDDLVTGTVSLVKPMLVYRFAGTAGDVVIAQGSPLSGGTPCLQMFGPDGARIGLSQCSESGPRIQSALSHSGEHTVLVTKASNDRGVTSAAFALTLERLVPASPTARAIAFGATKDDALTPSGRIHLYTFPGVAKTPVVVRVARRATPLPATPCVELFRSDATPVGSRVCSAFGLATLEVILDQTGPHTILVTEASNRTLAYTLTLPGPSIQTVSPSAGGNAGRVAVGIGVTGLAIQPGATVKLVGGGGPDITGTGVAVAP